VFYRIGEHGAKKSIFHPQLHVIKQPLVKEGLPAHIVDLSDQLRALAELDFRTDKNDESWLPWLPFLSGRSRALLLIVPTAGEQEDLWEMIPQGVTVIGVTLDGLSSDPSDNASRFSGAVLTVRPSTDLFEL
jgi:phage baseplate assembly protein gpV